MRFNLSLLFFSCHVFRVSSYFDRKRLLAVYTFDCFSFYCFSAYFITLGMTFKLQGWDVGAWTGLIWLRIGTSGGHL